MVTLAPITRAIKSSLFRVGDLSLNMLAGTPPEFGNLVEANFLVGQTQVVQPAIPTPPFTPPDVGSVVTSAYDELIIDIQPVVAADGSYSTTTKVEPFRHIYSAGVPFWFLIRCDGYGQQQLQTRNAALQLATSLVSAMWADANNYMLLHNLKGFAFLQADLNVVFPDGTCIDRTFQSALVQAAHANRRAAMVITSRPNDYVTLIGPTIIAPPPALPNPNSGQPLPYPIIGACPDYTDRIKFLYPNPIVDYPNISTIVTQASAMYSLQNRDTGWPLSIEFGCVIPIDATVWTPDGIVGLLANPPADTKLKNVLAFLAALGVTWLGLQSGPSGSVVPIPSSFMPPDNLVNTSGSANVWSQDSEVFVSYMNTAGTRIVRAFNPFFVERQVF